MCVACLLNTPGLFFSLYRLHRLQFCGKKYFFTQTTKKNVRSEVKKDWGEKKLQCFFLANCTSKHEFVHVQMFFEYMFMSLSFVGKLFLKNVKN